MRVQKLMEFLAIKFDVRKPKIFGVVAINDRRLDGME